MSTLLDGDDLPHHRAVRAVVGHAGLSPGPRMGLLRARDVLRPPQPTAGTARVESYRVLLVVLSHGHLRVVSALVLHLPPHGAEGVWCLGQELDHSRCIPAPDKLERRLLTH